MVVLNMPNWCPESNVDSLPNRYRSNDSANPGILIDTIEYSTGSPRKVSELIDLAGPTAKLIPEKITKGDCQTLLYPVVQLKCGEDRLGQERFLGGEQVANLAA